MEEVTFEGMPICELSILNTWRGNKRRSNASGRLACY